MGFKMYGITVNRSSFGPRIKSLPPVVYDVYQDGYYHTLPNTYEYRASTDLSFDLGEAIVSTSGVYDRSGDFSVYSMMKAYQYNAPATDPYGDTWVADVDSPNTIGARWLKVSYDRKTVINGLVIKTRNYTVGGYQDLVLQGSDDDQVWEDVKFVGDAGANHSTPILPINAGYQHYRVTGLNGAGLNDFSVARFYLLYNPAIA